MKFSNVRMEVLDGALLINLVIKFRLIGCHRTRYAFMKLSKNSILEYILEYY